MVAIQVNDQEAPLLQEILQSCFTELEMEIAHTDRKEFRTYLKGKESLLRRLIGELAAETAKTAR